MLGTVVGCCCCAIVLTNHARSLGYCFVVVAGIGVDIVVDIVVAVAVAVVHLHSTKQYSMHIFHPNILAMLGVLLLFCIAPIRRAQTRYLVHVLP